MKCNVWSVYRFNNGLYLIRLLSDVMDKVLDRNRQVGCMSKYDLYHFLVGILIIPLEGELGTELLSIFC